MRKRTITMMSYAARHCAKVGEVMEVVSIFAFISKCLCNGRSNINEQVLRTRRKKRKLFWPFAGLWLQIHYSGLCGCGDEARSGGNVMVDT